jgi:prepilin peptidase CpaA
MDLKTLSFPEAVSLGGLSIVLILAVIYDLRFHKIPNLITFPTVIAGIVYHTWMGGWLGFLFSLEGMALGLSLLIGFYILGGMGAGDVKLMAAVGGILGPSGVFAAFLGTALVGGVYALILAVGQGQVRGLAGRFRDTLRRYGTMLKSFFCTGLITYVPPTTPADKKKRPVLCYGLAIALGTLCSLIWPNL